MIFGVRVLKKTTANIVVVDYILRKREFIHLQEGKYSRIYLMWTNKNDLDSEILIKLKVTLHE